MRPIRNGKPRRAGGRYPELTAPDGAIGDELGWSVALDGTALLVSAKKDNDGGLDSGSAYLINTVPTPTLLIPSGIVTSHDTPVEIPVVLSTDGASLAATAFSIDYDAVCLDFDPTDTGGAGLPDAVTFATPANFSTMVFFDVGDTDGEIDISIADAFPSNPLTDGTLLTVTLTPICTPSEPSTIIAPVGFSRYPFAEQPQPASCQPMAQRFPGTSGHRWRRSGRS